MNRLTWTILLGLLLGGLNGACSDDSAGEPDAYVPPDAYIGPCHNEPTPAYEGQYQLVINRLEIGKRADGFDLDYDGQPDNVLAPFGNVANGSLRDSFIEGDIYIPIEIYGVDDVVNDNCVNFTIYVGDFPPDQDDDGERTAGAVGNSEGDCNDWDPDIRPGATEDPSDFVDNDCDGLADETGDSTPSTDNSDRDGDGYSLAEGDCDDRLPADWPEAPEWWDPTAIHPDAPEICGDGFDNNCDGRADELCHPYEPPQGFDEMVSIPLDAVSLTSDQSQALIVFNSAVIENYVLKGGPSVFKFEVDIDGRNSELNITSALVEATVSGYLPTGGLALEDARLGGVLNGAALDKVPNFAEDFYGVKGNTMLDVVVGPGGMLLGLPSIGMCMRRPGKTVDQPLPPDPCESIADCDDPDNFFCDVDVRAPDIDVDRDGIELFLDLNVDQDDDVFRVDTCVDGDGTVVQDEYEWAGDSCANHRECQDRYGDRAWSCSVNVLECYRVTYNCTEATDGQGNPRFVDGYSIVLLFDAIPTRIRGMYDSSQ